MVRHDFGFKKMTIIIRIAQSLKIEDGLMTPKLILALVEIYVVDFNAFLTNSDFFI